MKAYKKLNPFCLLATLLLLLSVTNGFSETPKITNAYVGSDHLFHFQLIATVGQSYTFQISTNQKTWTDVGSIFNVSNSLLTLKDSQHPVPTSGNLFYRARIGADPTFGMFFLEFANGGNFQDYYTPVINYPVTLSSYSAVFSVQNVSNYAAATNVFFTGPTGSGLVNSQANPNNSNTNSGEADYQSPDISSPAAAPGGNWTVNYAGSNRVISVPDPQAASRLVVPVPTATVYGGTIQSVRWAYKNATDGTALASAPSYLTQIQLQIEGTNGTRLYDSADFTSSTTNTVLTSTISWASVSSFNMAYEDALGNNYVVFFQKQ